MRAENDEVKYYQPRFARWIEFSKWDSIAEKLTDSSIEIITQVMNAKKDGDCNWVVWRNCDYVLERIRSIANQLN